MSLADAESRETRRKFRLISRLGRGGYGTVYLAEVISAGGFQKRVAIKVANTGVLDARAGARLLDEARMLGLVRHQAIVAVEGLISLEGRPAMVMEYVDGVSLAALAEQGPVPPRVVLEIGSVLAQALYTAWTTLGPEGRPLQMVHRDIKPSNILLTARGEVKLLDFGIARADLEGRHAQTTTGAVPGSLDYLAPERTELGGFGPAADVYALGAVLYELMRGEPLGQLRGNLRQFERTLNGRLDLLAARIGPDSPVLALVGNMLAHKPDARPTAREVRRDCDRIFDRMEGERLLDWAESTVLSLVALAEASATDEHTGRVYSEESFSLESLTPDEGRTELLQGAETRRQTADEDEGKTTELPRGGRRVVEHAESTSAAVVEPATEPRAIEPEPATVVPVDPLPAPVLVQSRPPRRVGRAVAAVGTLAVLFGVLFTQIEGIRGLLDVEGPVVVPAEVVTPKVEPTPDVPPETEPDPGSLVSDGAVEPGLSPPPPPQPVVDPPQSQGASGVVAVNPTFVSQPSAKPSTVSLLGPGTKIELKGNGKSVPLLPGETVSLKPGRYEVSATFEETGNASFSLGTYRLKEGKQVAMTCRSEEQQCTAVGDH